MIWIEDVRDATPEEMENGPAPASNQGQEK